MSTEFLNALPENFCKSRTSDKWLDKAAANLDLLLVDHAHCERKAADTGIRILKAYQDKPSLQAPISKLVREEMRHFELVLSILKKRGIPFQSLSACTYGQSLHEVTHKNCRELRLLDWLLIASIIEARSCERFYSLAPKLEDDLGRFYFKLYEAEKRHFQLYLQFAYDLFEPKQVDLRVDELLDIESEIISGCEEVFRFHSGVPIQ